MALTNCTECNNEVSTKANNCPNCGAPIKPNGGGMSGGALEGIGFVLIVSGMIAAMATTGPVDTASKTAAVIGIIVFLAGRFKRQ